MIGFVVAGLIIGALARLLMPGRQKIGLLWTLLLGLAGSVIGGSIANLIGTGDIMELNVLGFIVAVLSAVGLLVVAERARPAAGSQAARPRVSALTPPGLPTRWCRHCSSCASRETEQSPTAPRGGCCGRSPAVRGGS